MSRATILIAVCGLCACSALAAQGGSRDLAVRPGPRALPPPEDYSLVASTPPGRDCRHWTAANAVHGMRAAFGESGVQLDMAEAPHSPLLELTLAGYGRCGDVRPVDPGKPSACGSRFELDRGLLVEWYVNEARGFEHGFTLHGPPPGDLDAPLQLRIELRHGFRAVLSDDGASLSFRDDAGAPRLEYSGLAAWDADGRSLPARMCLDGDGKFLSIVVEASGAEWPVTVDPFLATQEGKLTASDGAAQDNFGSTVSLSGNTAIVGAFADDDAGTNSGSAYVFVRTGTTWTQQAKLTASDAAAVDNFGISVAVDGDTVVVGSPKDNSPQIDAGSAYVFTRSGTSWSQQAKLVASDQFQVDEFGNAVAVDGDTAVIGAHWEEFGIADHGAVYVFVRNGAAWSQQQKLIPFDAVNAGNYGRSVAVDGDTMAVTAAGRVYVYVRSGTVWTFQQEMFWPSGADGFGAAIALAGNLLAVPAFLEDLSGFQGVGAVYLYERSGTTWTQKAKLTPASATAGMGFGSSVAVGDGLVIVGAPGSSGTGRVFVFGGGGSVWSQLGVVAASDSASGDAFGTAVALAGDTIVAGAQSDDTTVVDTGSAYVFRLSGIANAPPVVTAAPAPGSLVTAPGGVLQFTVKMSGPEPEQSVNLTIDKGTLQGLVAVATPGNPATVACTLTPSTGDVGAHPITITGTDNGTPPKATTLPLAIEVLPSSGALLCVDLFGPSLTFDWTSGGSAPAPIARTVLNCGLTQSALPWKVETVGDLSWLSIFPAAGTIPPVGSQQVTFGLLAVPSGGSATHSGKVRFISLAQPEGGTAPQPPVELDAKLYVTFPGELVITCSPAK